jgi:small subunit ribosomal protein S4
MAKQIGPLCRLCRRQGVKLFLKGNRCVSNKCSFEKRSFSPGQHGQNRVKLSDYGLQLREKQKVKRIYGVLERQFRSYFKKAEKQKGITGEILLQLLERRLDNVIFRSCFASSRPQARQLVKHGLISVNDRKTDIPSYLVKKGDIIQIKTVEPHLKRIAEAVKENKDRGVPKWIQLEEERLAVKIAELPARDDVGFPIQEQLIVELYSK